MEIYIKMPNKFQIDMCKSQIKILFTIFFSKIHQKYVKYRPLT